MSEPKQTSRLATQTRSITDTITHALASLGPHQPLDRLLSVYYKQHRWLGSRDRRAIGDMLFALTRWWGWVEPLTPAIPNCSLPRTTPPHNADNTWPALLLTLVALDAPATHTDLIAYWEQLAGLPPGTTATAAREPDPYHRLQAIRTALTPAASPQTAPPLAALIPPWIPDRLEPGTDLTKLATWITHHPPLWLRAQTKALDAVLDDLRQAGLTPTPHPRLPAALNLGKVKINLLNLPSYEKGLVEVQDLASQAVGMLCAPQPGEQWWDACAGSGGKALHLASLMEGRGRVTATDTRPDILRNLRVRAERGGLSNIHTEERNVAEQPAPQAQYDGLLLDVPCTGSGRWRRAPDRLWIAPGTTIEDATRRQQAILRNTAPYVRPKGILVYATCSIFPCENEAIIADFLATTPAFRPDPCPHPLTGQPTSGIIRITPEDGDCNGMFMARLRRQA